MKDAEIIEQLNSKLRNPLKLRDKLTWFLKGYCVNDNGDVIQLNLFNSQLKGEIPDEVFDLKHLEHLDIRENELSCLPDKISNLKQLQSLDARYNLLKDLPDSFSGLEYLEKLYLGNNSFSSIPSIVSEMESLWLIDLTDNKISKDCEHLFSAPMLTNIYLKNNQLTNFPFDSINAYIDELNLSENQLNVDSSFKHEMVNNLIL